MILRICGIAILCLGLIGCNGFKLRGSTNKPAYLNKIYISPCEPYEPLQRKLRENLKYLNISVIDAPQENVTRLELSRSTTSEQVLAYSSSGEAQRFKLTFSVAYTLIIPEKPPLRKQQTVTRFSELNRSNNMLLSNDSQEQIIKQELLDATVAELIRQIMIRPAAKESSSSSSNSADNNPC